MEKKKLRKSANYKVLIVSITMALLFVVVGANVFVVSVLGYHLNSGTDFRDDINGIHTVERKIPANRGKIVDRNDTVIAQDLVAYTLQASLDESRMHSDKTPAHIDDKEKAAKVISEVIGTPYDKVLEIISQDALQVEFGYAGKYLTLDQKTALEDSKIPGLMFEKIITRNYPLKVFASKLIGYSQYDELEEGQIGQMGLESAYNDVLEGTNGFEQYTHDRDNFRLRFDDGQRKDPINGNDVKLTLDRGIQDSLERALLGITQDPGVKASEAWGIVMEVKTGKILAWGDAPSFDPNAPDFSNGFTNRVSQSTFEPGSTMKTFTVAAAIEEGVWNNEETFDSNPFHVGVENKKAYRLPSEDGSVHTITNAGGHTYGQMRYDYGYALSSNVMIAELLTRKLDPEVFHDYLYKLGFFKNVNTDKIPEEQGYDLWQEPLEKISNGFGQGSSASVLQLAQAYTSVLNKGVMVKPYYIDEIKNSQTGEVIYKGQTQNLGKVFSEETAKKVQDLMRYVVDITGSGYRFNIPETNVIAKTGTAQTVVEGVPGYSPTIYNFSSAVALPYEDPEVLVYTAYKANYGHDVDYSAVYIRDILHKIAATYGMTNEGGKESITEITVQELQNYINSPVPKAKESLESLGYKPVIIGDGETVINQKPEVNRQVINNERVYLYAGDHNMTMPDFKGWTRKEIFSFMSISGLNAEVSGSGYVTEQSIPPGTIFTKDDTVSLKLN
ncbi:penicillin-binding protein [Erysipelothrix rhusiopathiae]|nr:penicillin-binding protein [Erysipelothrix rhusiopathiae]MDE8041837.1 penicillin-binding protein [Erysipelothrix rhusiopathiae]MDE8050248.1 penicillin-binding protein [Erysipelothrix rhusiopathiae]MDE8052592.1 penicillin-binding protein [Erysipelothrix rhusiopathiae]MDE8058106.1 penicillin-binding protein [Erysipelothrix rhusiopathiae]